LLFRSLQFGFTFESIKELGGASRIIYNRVFETKEKRLEFKGTRKPRSKLVDPIQIQESEEKKGVEQ